MRFPSPNGVWKTFSKFEEACISFADRTGRPAHDDLFADCTGRPAHDNLRSFGDRTGRPAQGDPSICHSSRTSSMVTDGVAGFALPFAFALAFPSGASTLLGLAFFLTCKNQHSSPLGQFPF